MTILDIFLFILLAIIIIFLELLVKTLCFIQTHQTLTSWTGRTIINTTM